MMQCGIYKIHNKINDKIYIGQSINIKERLRIHKTTLKNNKHYNKHLQNSWNKYGENNFEFSIIEYCGELELTNRENYWMNFYNSFDYNSGYNQLKPSENNQSYRLSDNAKKLMSEKHTIYSDAELISYLQEFYYMNGKVSTSRELKENKNYPNSGTYELRFGSLKNALIEADLYMFVKNKKDFDRQEYDKEQVIKSIKEFINENKRFPNRSDLDNNNKLPSYSTIFKLFKTIDNAKIECNYDDTLEKELEKEEMLNALRRLYHKDGYVTSRTIDKCKFTRSASYYQKIFGSLIDAFKLAGVQSKKKYKLLEDDLYD